MTSFLALPSSKLYVVRDDTNVITMCLSDFRMTQTNTPNLVQVYDKSLMMTRPQVRGRAKRFTSFEATGYITHSQHGAITTDRDNELFDIYLELADRKKFIGYQVRLASSFNYSTENIERTLVFNAMKTSDYGVVS